MSASQIKTKMLLVELLNGLAIVPQGKNVEVTGVSEYSGDVTHGDVFLAEKNLHYVADAIANGAVAIVCESGCVDDSISIDSSVPLIECNNLADYVGEIVARFYGRPGEKIKTIAITGTDGKSSVAHLVAQALEGAEIACGLVGTLGYGRLSGLSEATHTTPPRARIAKEYSNLISEGCDVVAIEASSHGIAQGRLEDTPIHTAVLTNITRDHLDYHGTVLDYIQAKAKLFFSHDPEHAVINLDDQVGKKWIEELQALTKVITFSLSSPNADVYTSKVQYLKDGTVIKINIRASEYLIRVPLMGEFNVLNILAVAATLISLDKKDQEIISALQSLTAVPGRMQCVSNELGLTAIVDYAHTPAALFAAINAVRQHCSGKLICVFGCGGNRDTGKRLEMGKVATSYADFVVVTSDNPRKEEPEKIINDIVSGFVPGPNYTSITDRKEAIIYALQTATSDDAVLIAGKGHERFQYINEAKLEFDDVQITTQELQRMAHG